MNKVKIEKQNVEIFIFLMYYNLFKDTTHRETRSVYELSSLSKIECVRN